MKFGRYKHWTDESWAKGFKDRKARTPVMSEPWIPDVLVEMNARLIVVAYHKGPWRAIWALIKHELGDVWLWYCWPRWEWIRVHIFRLPQDEAIAEFERVNDEIDALEDLYQKL